MQGVRGKHESGSGVITDFRIIDQLEEIKPLAYGLFGVRPGELGKLTPADIYDLAAGYRNREERENEKIKIIIDYVCNNLNSRMDYWGSYVCALLSVGLGIKKKAGQEEFLPKPKKEGPADKRSWQDLKADFMAFAAAHNAAIKGR